MSWWSCKSRHFFLCPTALGLGILGPSFPTCEVRGLDGKIPMTVLPLTSCVVSTPANPELLSSHQRQTDRLSHQLHGLCHCGEQDHAPARPGVTGVPRTERSAEDTPVWIGWH